MTRGYSLVGWIEYGSWHLMRCLPTILVSGLGWVIGLAHYPAFLLLRPDWIDDIDASFERVGAGRSASRRRIARYFANVGQVMAESSILDRFLDNGRVTITGVENAVVEGRTTVFAGAHLSNWELMAVAPAVHRFPTTILYWPPNDPARRDIIEKLRRVIAAKVPGNRAVASTGNAMRTLVKAAANGEHLLIFADEQKDGVVWAPKFGRDIADQGNRHFVARLAVNYGVRVVPVFVLRTGLARYQVNIEPALEASGEGDVSEQCQALVEAIEARFAHWIRRYPEQWYWMGELTNPRGYLIDGPGAERTA